MAQAFTRRRRSFHSAFRQKRQAHTSLRRASAAGRSCRCCWGAGCIRCWSCARRRSVTCCGCRGFCRGRRPGTDHTLWELLVWKNRGLFPIV